MANIEPVRAERNTEFAVQISLFLHLRSEPIVRSVRIIQIIIIVVRTELPAIGLVDLVDLPFHVLEHLLLERSETLVHVERRLVGLGDYVELNKLPLDEAFRFLDVVKWIAGHLRGAVRPFAKEFTISALYHGRVARTLTGGADRNSTDQARRMEAGRFRAGSDQHA